MGRKDLHFDYTTVGHVTVDVMANGSRRVGGTAFYSALQAARLGRRTLIITRGSAAELEGLLEPYRGELELAILPARRTTTLHTTGRGAARVQRLLAWAGPLGDDVVVETSILHLAPVARETPGRWRGRADFVGLTPQGLVRRWAGREGEISLRAPAQIAVAAPQPPGAPRAGGDSGDSGDSGDRIEADTGAEDALDLAGRCDAVVLSDYERDSCAQLIAAASRAGAVVAITSGSGPNAILLADGTVLESPVPRVEQPRDDLGAGDVFAAAFFVALAEGASAGSAAEFANAAAAVRVQGAGVDAIGDRPAIEAHLRAGAGTAPPR
ncbi:MAG: PfkB domain protein [Solirubrobacterales bacterium]|nr:PfkB domain protein [Solirubrobacterales bacterium]